MENDNAITITKGVSDNDTSKKNILVRAFQCIPKKIILFISGVALIIIFFLLPANRIWLNEKIIGYWNDFVVQRKQLSIERRKIKRFGTEYSYSTKIATFFEEKGSVKNVLVLIPSTAYFKNYGLAYEVPEPVTFYYFTGLKTISANNKNASLANWYVTVKDNAVHMDSVINRQSLLDTINAFKKY